MKIKSRYKIATIYIFYKDDMCREKSSQIKKAIPKTLNSYDVNIITVECLKISFI